MQLLMTSLLGNGNLMKRDHAGTTHCLWNSGLLQISSVIVWNPYQPCPLKSCSMECILWRLVRALEVLLDICPLVFGFTYTSWSWKHLSFYFITASSLELVLLFIVVATSIVLLLLFFLLFFFQFGPLVSFGPKFSGLYIYICQPLDNFSSGIFALKKKETD